MVKRVANSRCRPLVTTLQDFKASNLYAETSTKREDGLRAAVREALAEPLKVYTVYSYGTHFPIYVNAGGTWYGNKEKYSVSTGRHKSQAKPEAAEIIYVSTVELKAIAGLS